VRVRKELLGSGFDAEAEWPTRGIARDTARKAVPVER
jgi:hypothetical protein